MRDDLSGLRELILVAEKRSFTAAAAELRITPSAVSQTVRALAERVGVRLLQRTTRSVGLTEAGERFMSRLRPAMASVHEAFDALGELRDRPAGVMRLTVSRIAYEQLLAARMPAFLDTYPEITLDVSVDDALTNIVEHGFDAGIRIGEMLDREMIGVKLSAELRMAVVGSPAYFAAHGKPKHPRDLQAYDCLSYRRKSSGVIPRWEFTDGGKDFTVAVSGRLLVDDAELMARSAMAGLGLAYLIESHVRDLLTQKKLVRVLEGFCPPFPGFYLYYPSRAQLAPKLKAFVDFFKYESRRKR